ncbi:MAG: SDR family oxidoreductase [Rhodobacter sp.]|nr:SDR family oxidoreductase [Rhodobacter sp.]MCY4167252.1 SDR family oxidoreductase [Rhodobacter sp.]MCY4243459.1 SDR family oxidoreductase [Rhodobacter sp.]
MKLPRTPSFRLDGRCALVTGGSRGIGLGCAVALAEAGAEVVLAARGRDELEMAAGAMREAGLDAIGVVLDVTDLNAMRAVFADRGPFGIVVNSAGIARHSLAMDTGPEDFDTVTAVNFRAAYFLAREAAMHMKQGGSIIQISSQMGHIGGIERAVYCGTKHGVEGFTKAMAIEWGDRGIRVNTVCPTFIRTPLTEATLDDPRKRDWIMSMIKLGRIAEVEDVMGAVLFLASDASAMVTGTSILVDGGWTAH